MIKYAYTLALIFALAFSPGALARPPYPALFMEEYQATPDVIKAAKNAKCNVCHDAAPGKTKRDRNEFGKALSMHVTAADFKMLMGNRAGLAAKVSAALQATEKEKNAAGQTFGEVIKSGKLPAP